MPSSPGSDERRRHQERRFLIAAGTARYRHLPKGAQLPSVREDLRLIVELFTRKLGYERVLPGLGNDPTSDQLRRRLSAWLRDPDRRASDVIVLYYSGHGKKAEDPARPEHYLLTSDSNPDDLVGTAFRTEDLGRMLKGATIQQLLVLLDTCYSGAGAVDFSTIAGEVAGSLNIRKESPSGIYFLTAGRPKDAVRQGVFARAFVQVVQDPPARYAGTRQPALPLPGVRDSINEKLEHLGQRCFLTASGAGPDPLFLPNLGHTGAPEGIDVEAQRRWAGTYRQDLTTHWGPRGRGVEIESQAGWYFTGRVAALRRLVAWLAAPKSVGKPCVVTGSPGTGKSALLARLVTLSDPEYRKKVPLDGVPRGTAPPRGCINLAIHAKGRTLEDCTAWIAGAAGIPATLGGRFDLRLVSWADGTGVPTSGERLFIVGVDDNSVLHIRICDAGGVRDTDETELPTTQTGIISRLKRRLPKLLPPHDLTPAEKAQVIREVTSIVDRISPAMLVDALARQGTPWVILLDALDEAQDPLEIARELLHPLSLAPTVRLVIGTRRDGLLPALGSAPMVIDLDDPEYADRAEIAEYVRRRLLAEGDPTRPTPYRGQAELAAKVAEAVSEKAYPVFLIARLISQTLIQSAEPVDPSRPEWREQFPSTVGDAFDKDLDRFGARKRRVRDLLRPLAYAEGAGLPWEGLWAPLATAMAGVPYADADVEWLLDVAGSYILEGVEEDRSVYRLYHQALADHLRLKRRDQEIQRRFTGTLIEETRRDGRDWLGASPYVRQHLAAHAARAGVLGDLVADPLYLVAAEPSRLLRAMIAQSRGLPREPLHVYQGAIYHLQTPSFAERASYLEMVARQSGLNSFADRIGQLPLRRRFSVPWAHWQADATHRVMITHEAQVKSVAMAQLGGRPVVVSTGHDGTVHVWDLDAGAPVGRPLRAQEGAAVSVTVDKWDGRPMVVLGGLDGKVRVVGLTESESVGRPLAIYEAGTQSVAVGELKGHAIILSGDYSGKVQVWDLDAGAPVGQPISLDERGVPSLAVTKLKRRPVFLAGADDGRVRVWDLDRRRPVGEPLRGHEDKVSSLAVVERQGRRVILSGSWDRTIRVWSLETLKPLGPPLLGHKHRVLSVAVGQGEDGPIIVSGSEDGEVRVWDLDTLQPIGEPLRGHESAVWSVAVGQQAGRPAIISGSWDGTVRVWDMDALQPLGDSLRGQGALISSVVPTEIEGCPAVVTSSAGESLRVWDLDSGASVGKPMVATEASLMCLAVGAIEDRTVIVAGDWYGMLHRWDLESRRPLGEPLRGHEKLIGSVAVGEIDGRPVVVSAGDDGMVRVWDLASGRSEGQPIRASKEGLSSVAVGQRMGRPVIVAGGRTVRVWDLATRRPLNSPSSRHEEKVSAVAVGRLDDRSVIVSGWYWDGTIRVWDLASFQPLGRPRRGLTSYVSSVAVGELDGRTAILSAGNGVVQVWGRSDQPESTIFVDADVRSAVLAPGSRIVVATSKGLMVLQWSPTVHPPPAPRKIARRAKL